jgi:adenylate cyclase
MPDIFLSYNREDQATARRFAEAFQGQGFSVWWDTTLRAGEAYDEVTEAALNEAKAVVVLWSPRSVVSRWVRAEATQADRNRTLVPVTIEACKRPIMFELTQTADLSHWDGAPEDGAWRSFLADVRRFVDSNGAPALPLSAVSQGAGARPAGPADEAISIAVLPFVNMSSDPEQEYFSDGLSEELLNQLAQIKTLRVAGRTSSFAFKGKTDDLRQIGARLGVNHVLEGSVRKAGNRLRITAQLIKCSDGFHLWSQTYDRQLDDVFAIQDEVAREVTEALGVTLGVGETVVAPGGTRNIEAYDLYLRALALGQQASYSTSLRTAEMMRRAVALDPEFANGWLLLAESLTLALDYGEEADRRLREERDQALDRVEAIAPDLWSGHAARAGRLMSQRRFFDAERTFATAIELGPRDFPPANQFGMLIAGAGRTNEAIAYLYRVREADPLRPVPVLLMFLVIAGRYAEADAEYSRTKEMALGPLQLADWFAFAQMLATKDRASAKRRLASLVADGAAPAFFYGGLLEVFDDSDAAVAWIERSLTDPSPEMEAVVILFAYMAAYFGAHDYALRLLRRHFIELAQPTPSLNIWHPVFAEVRKLPDFKDLVRDLAVYDHWRQSGKWGDFARPVGDDDFEIVR